MIVFPQFTFASPPATGAEWFLNGCELVSLTPVVKTSLFRQSPPFWGRFSLSIVRHPLSWLWSYFSEVAPRIVNVPEVDTFAEDFRGCQGNFGHFAESYLRRHPGSISRMFDSYRPTSVIRFEDFPWSAIEFLQSLVDTERTWALLKTEPPSYVAGWMENKDLRRDIVRAERKFCARLEYY